MANRQYISLIRLFDHCDIAYRKDFNVTRAKKQLLAEFSISGDGFINVDQYVYSRSDVFEELERPDFIERLAFHIEIWERPAILQVLEQSKMEVGDFSMQLKTVSNRKKFEVFFSPWFSGPFAHITRTFLERKELYEAGKVFYYEFLLEPSDREEAFRPTRIFMEQSLRMLRNTSKENYSVMREKISHWVTTDWAYFFNDLPGEFYEIKEDIVYRLVNLYVEVQKTQRKDCRKVSNQLVRLEGMESSLMLTINSNHAVYSSSSYSARPYWVAGWLVLICLKFVFWGPGCNSSRGPDYSNLKIYDGKFNGKQDSNIQRLIDSLRVRGVMKSNDSIAMIKRKIKE